MTWLLSHMKNKCVLSHPIECFPWDFHWNEIPMDKEQIQANKRGVSN